MRQLLKKAGLEPRDIIRRREKTYKELGLGPDSDPDELIRLMVENPNLLERPIVEIADQAVLARPIEKAIELLRTAH